jgi:signal transduction histidine kinase
VFAFVAVTLSHLVATWYTHASAAELTSLGEAVSRSQTPSMQELGQRMASVRAATFRTRLVLDLSCAAFAAVCALLVIAELRRKDAAIASGTRLLERRAEELDQFAARVAHDIVNPLASAKIALDLLLRQRVDRRSTEVLLRAQRSLERAESIIGGLLEFARAGAKSEAGAETAPDRVIASALLDLTREASENSVVLEIGPVPACKVACTDGVFTVMLSNLVLNAVKHMGAQAIRRVVVRAFDRGDRVRIEVEDTGPGIAPEVRGSLFEPYVRGPAARAGGLGLGLATVKRLADGHGGATGVESISGCGARFWFELPAVPLEGVSRPAPT